ncbi:MAG TPA: carboxypeptidase regulatory-like domain-containing protein, partial [Mucilaginibacter sp.]|nr:carboxypeptidase regulatory-like domain-containing protein [Mucilaginibacter sp.]
MKKLFILAVLIMLSGQLFAQATGGTPPPLASRDVSGIVKDETGQTVIGALVTLKSKSDTIRTATNEDGIFIFKGVKEATFVVSIESIGYAPAVKKYLNNDVAKRITLDPVVLKTKANELNTVVINGTPSITYKTDTVEYRASDYKVRENSSVDELLKKMEGMEVGTDGTLTHQGQQVTKARVNGKDFAGGNVAQAIQNLPADIVDKIQVVDDYGDQAGRTGIKDGDPTKVLNITTRADRSVGNIARITASGGNDDRYDERLFAQRLNGNQQIGFIGNLTNTVNGVASTGI